MTTMNVSLPDSLKDFVDEQVARRNYGSTSEYIRELVRRDQERSQLRELLIDGVSSSVAVDVDDAFLASLRARVSASTME